MLFSLFCLLAALSVSAAIEDLVCEDYSPCTCEVFSSYGLVVRCGDPFNDQLSVSVKDVQRVFNSTKARHLFWLDLLLSPETGSEIVSIPANLLGVKIVDRLGISCSAAVEFPSVFLEVDAKAFHSSIHKLGHFEVGGCDLSKWSMKFLARMTRLVSLSVSRATQFQGFPPLASLSRIKSLRIYECAEFQHWSEIAQRFPRLESLYLDGNLQGDRLVNEVLSSVAFERNTLQQLSLWQSRLSRIPESLKYFSKLNYVNLFGNAIRSVPKGSLTFSPDISVTFLIFTNNIIDTIEPGAFEGKFYFYLKTHFVYVNYYF